MSRIETSDLIRASPQAKKDGPACARIFEGDKELRWVRLSTSDDASKRVRERKDREAPKATESKAITDNPGWPRLLKASGASKWAGFNVGTASFEQETLLTDNGTSGCAMFATDRPNPDHARLCSSRGRSGCAKSRIAAAGLARAKL